MLDLVSRVKAECQKNYSKNYSIQVPEDWLSQCIEFILEEFPSEQINNYVDLTFKQLIDYDLNVIGTSCLPQQLFNSSNGFIEGSFLLQIMLCIDSSQSYYSKLQKLKGVVNENMFVDADIVPTATQFEKKDAKKNRFLTLFLSDGSKAIKAIEYRPIQILNEEILPGTKIQLKGRIMYRQGVLFLGPENFKLVGGTVEDLTTMQSLIEIIEQELNDKRSDRRSVNEREKVLKLNGTKPSAQNFQKTNLKTEPPRSTYSPDEFQTTNNYQKYNNCTNSNNNKLNYQKPMTIKSGLVNNNDDDDDDLLMNCDLKSLEKSNLNLAKSESWSKMKRPPSTESLSSYSLQQQQQQKNQPQFSNQTNRKKFKIEEEENEDDFFIANKLNDFPKSTNSKTGLVKQEKKPILTTNNEDDEFLNYLSSKPNVKPAETTNRPLTNNFNMSNKQPTTNKIKIEKNDRFKNEHEDEDDDDLKIFLNTIPQIKKEKLVKEMERNEIKFESLSSLRRDDFIQGCCLKNRGESLSTCTHLVKGFFETLTAKLRQIKLKWYQECVISDETSSLEAYLGDEPISSLLGLTCMQVKEMYKRSVELAQRVTSQTKEQEEFEKSRKACETKLESMRCVMHLKYDLEKMRFCVFKLSQVELNAKKMSKENL